MMDDRVDLSRRRALITGAASGIGLAIAKRLGELGASVVIADLPGARLGEVESSIPRSTSIGADLGKRDQVHQVAKAAGDIDILVNNAGFQHVSPIEEFDEAKWDSMVAVMLNAPFVLIKDLVPGMYRRDWGRIINIASVHGLVASPFKAAYVSAKHGLLGLTKTIALEAATHSQQVTVNAICPSYVRTPLVEKQIADQAKHHGISESEVIDRILLDRNALKRLIEPEDVAAMVAFLCRDDMWSITGRALPMDAGWLAH
jgi:3-hydroxybutyrate dehydrogenase